MVITFGTIDIITPSYKTDSKVPMKPWIVASSIAVKEILANLKYRHKKNNYVNYVELSKNRLPVDLVLSIRGGGVSFG